MSMSKRKPIKYNDGRTKQSFRDETDINQILKRAQKTGTISHLNKYEARYGDFSNFDFFEAQIQLAKGGEIFDALPMELRKEFNQSPADFFEYVNDPENKDDLARLLPGLAEPGRQNIATAPPKADESKALEEGLTPEEKVAPTSQAKEQEDGVLKVTTPPAASENPSTAST